MWGQSAAAIERAYDIVAEAWTRIDDNGDAFRQGMSGVLDSWVGSVEVGCARHLGDFGDFVAGQRDAMSQLLQEFAHYAVVLSSARKDIVKAMRALVDACVQLGNNQDDRHLVPHHLVHRGRGCGPDGHYRRGRVRRCRRLRRPGAVGGQPAGQ